MVHVEVPDREVADQVVSYTSAGHSTLRRAGGSIACRWFTKQSQPRGGWPVGMDAVSIALGSYVRMEPSHDETADPEFGAAAKIRASF